MTMHGEAPSTHEAVRGTVGDRPWGVTLGALGLDGRTGELTLRHGGKSYRIAFFRGAIIGADSPLAADSAVRIALTSKLITPVQADELKQRVKTARANRLRHRAVTGKGLDDVDVIADHLRWSPGQAESLRNTVIARCAARTFAIDDGDYVLEDRIVHDATEGNVDVRAVVYLGVRMHLSQQRLAFDLRQLGAWFVLKPKLVDLSGFGFGDVEAPILDALRNGTNLPDLEARDRSIDPRTVQAVLYALAACDAVVCCEPPAMTSTPLAAAAFEPMITRVPTPREPTITRVPTPREPTLSQFDTTPWGLPTVTVPNEPEPRAQGTQARRTPLAHTVSREEIHARDISLGPPGAGPRPKPAATESIALGPSGVPQHGAETDSRRVLRSATDTFEEARTTRVRPNALAAHEIAQLITSRSTLLDHGVDHFTLLGLPPGATPEEVRDAYVELARYLEPKRLTALGIRDEGFTARRLFAQICIAVTVLTDPDRRKEYVASLRRS